MELSSSLLRESEHQLCSTPEATASQQKQQTRHLSQHRPAGHVLLFKPEDSGLANQQIGPLRNRMSEFSILYSDC